jgi:hypothetical protein
MPGSRNRLGCLDFAPAKIPFGNQVLTMIGVWLGA